MAIARSHPRLGVDNSDPLRRAASHPRGGPLPLDPLRTATSDPLRRASTSPRGGPLSTVTSEQGGGFRPPYYVPPPAPPPQVPAPPPAYQPPPQAPSNYTRDPRIDELLRELQRGENGGSNQPNVGTLDLNGIERQSAQLRALLAQLMRGEGVKVGDLSNDPAQRAYELKTGRAAERLRESEAARAGASGGADAGGFDGRIAQIMTETGESNAANMADLINKRRSEKLATALAGANLQLSDLSRQAGNKQAEHGSLLERERLRLAGEATKGTDRQRLLDALMMEDRQRRESQERGNYYDKDLAERRRIEERDQAERLRLEELARNPGGPRVPYNPYGYQPLRGW